jgi:NADH dehydrogenase
MGLTKVVIIGGGFAAVRCAKTLRKKLKAKECRIVIYSRENHMVFHPLLADVASGSINPDSAAATLRQMLPEVECRTENIERVDISASRVEYLNEKGESERTNFDHVVIACGAESNLGIIPGMSDRGFPFKTMADAIALRAHIVDQMEKAEATSDLLRRRFLLSFVIIGGGFSGVEIAGEINELVRGSVRFYRNFDEEDIRVTLIHNLDQILPEVSPSLRVFAWKKMQRAGINILLKTSAVVITPEGVGLEDGRLIQGATIVCTIGTAPSLIVQHLDVPKKNGRLVTQTDMRVSGLQNIWAIGDCAYIINAFDDKPSPTTAQFAERQGRQAAENIVRALRSEPTRPFYFKPLGQLCSIGGHRAVAEMFGFRISGILAWFIWRSVYLLKLPSWSRRTKVAFDWSWDLLFARDLGTLRTDKNQMIARAHYRPGDFIYLQGDAANHFYVVEEGEVELFDSAGTPGGETSFTVMGPGGFFGDAALFHNQPYKWSSRARTDVRVAAIKRSVFSQLTGALAPLRESIIDSLKQQLAGRWLNLPASKEALRNEPLSSFLESAPMATLRPESTLEQAVALLTGNDLGFLAVVDDQQLLVGVLNRLDLTRAIELLASIAAEGRDQVRKMRLLEFVPAKPVAVSLDDSSFLAASLMLQNRLTWIPVVKSKTDLHLKGYVRGERMSSWLVHKLESQTPARSQAASRG